MSVYTSIILLGMHVIQGVLGTIQLPTYIQTLSRDRSTEPGDPLFTVPSRVEVVNRFAPLRQDLKPKKLLRRLGNDFKPFWMSLDLPVDMFQTHIRRRAHPSRDDELDSVNFTVLENSLQIKYGHAFSSTSNSSDMSKGILDLVRSWLVEKASCPVYYLWEDLGLLYWPRWVRRGLCSLKDSPLVKLNSQPATKIPNAADCSWPPGMHCIPAKTKQLKILLWQCRDTKAISSSDRLPLPGTGRSHSSPNRSKRHGSRGKSFVPHQTNESQHLKMQVGDGQRGTVALVSDKTSPLTRRQGRILRGNQQILPADNTTQNNILLKKNDSNTRGIYTQHKDGIDTQHTGERHTQHTAVRDTQHTEVITTRDQALNSIRNKSQRKSELEANDTGTWSGRDWRGKDWRERRLSLNLKCRWVKVPYPVTDNCLCSC